MSYTEKNILCLIIVFFTFLTGKVEAQLSPGDLTNSHKHLEGISNCTQCHDLGSKVSNNKCLACHKEIRHRLDNKEGFHNTKDVKSKDCATCHSDHNGRNFDMVRFDEKTFNHTAAGYELTGGHKKIDCRDCHKPEYIPDPILKKRKETYLGLDRACAACHKDPHQKTLGNDCSKCHTTEAFAPAGKFNHDKTDFALTGRHKTVTCVECHQKETKNGLEYQRFSGVPFKNCNSCHTDPHKSNLGTNCKECHTDQSFSAVGGLSKFNHSKTPFPLKGKHKQVDCRECHQMEASPATIFQDRLGVLTSQCSTCHKDVHEGKFGINCAECHNEIAFLSVSNLEVFDHDRTSFALQGKHETVDCRKCHISEKLTDPLPHNTCATCHKDYHESQFAVNGASPDCSKCHTVDGFAGSLFTLEDHQKTKMPLDGAHIATPCFACHQQDGKWTFRGLGERCVDCHQDIHAGQIAEKWYPDQACQNCHQTSVWRDNKFDHNNTNFKLSGKHALQDCRACHVPDAVFTHGKFAGLAAQCSACHDNVHDNQFEIKGVTDCTRCHGFEDWTMADFDHKKTKFPLDGKHATVKCAECHKPVIRFEKTIIQYKFESFECAVCHQ